MCRAQRLPRPPPSTPPLHPCRGLAGLSAESGRPAGRDPKYLAPPRPPGATLGGRDGGGGRTKAAKQTGS